MLKRANRKQQTSGDRPKLPRISEETKRLSALIEVEVLRRPGVVTRPMFGLNGLYRGRKIFAVLPRTRAMDVADSIAFRLPSRPQRIVTRLRTDRRIIFPETDAKWISFIIESDADIHDALHWLEFAYREAGKPSR